MQKDCKMDNKSFCAGIVTFNPDIVRLNENVCAIKKQVDSVVIIDNGSHEDLLSKYEKQKSISVIRNSENKGIAYALNQICNYAFENGYEWAVTLDQDSVVPDNLIGVYDEQIYNFKIGMLTPQIYDRNCGLIKDSEKGETETVDICITSASAIRISAWQEIGGFYEPYFIDAVDFDICYCLREHGYDILRCNKVRLLHELGHSRFVNFMGFKTVLYNHSPLRYYYISRNALLLGKRHDCTFRWFMAVAKRLILVLLYEDEKFAKCKMFIRGIKDYCKGQFGRYESK